ncbi:hypothetical protein ABK040_001587 [Willaertia magna]
MNNIIPSIKKTISSSFFKLLMAPVTNKQSYPTLNNNINNQQENISFQKISIPTDNSSSIKNNHFSLLTSMDTLCYLSPINYCFIFNGKLNENKLIDALIKVIGVKFPFLGSTINEISISDSFIQNNKQFKEITKLMKVQNRTVLYFDFKNPSIDLIIEKDVSINDLNEFNIYNNTTMVDNNIIKKLNCSIPVKIPLDLNILKNNSLFKIKINYLTNGNTAISISMCHSLGDAASLFTFMDHWAYYYSNESFKDEIILFKREENCLLKYTEKFNELNNNKLIKECFVKQQEEYWKFGLFAGISLAKDKPIRKYYQVDLNLIDKYKQNSQNISRNTILMAILMKSKAIYLNSLNELDLITILNNREKSKEFYFGNDSAYPLTIPLQRDFLLKKDISEIALFIKQNLNNKDSSHENFLNYTAFSYFNGDNYLNDMMYCASHLGKLIQLSSLYSYSSIYKTLQFNNNNEEGKLKKFIYCNESIPKIQISLPLDPNLDKMELITSMSEKHHEIFQSFL